jgi:hypothetical protein
MAIVSRLCGVGGGLGALVFMWALPGGDFIGKIVSGGVPSFFA